MKVAFDARGLVPAIAQEARTGRVLMLAWMSEESIRLTRETGEAWYFSRSRGALWRKGETSGHTQRVVDMRLDCDGDAVLLLVEQVGPACHTGEPSCFFRDHDGDASLGVPPAGMVDRLRAVIATRRGAAAGTSYTASLLHAGMAKILAKVDEEAGELVQALRQESDDRVVSEAADLLYHVMVGFEARGIDPQAVALELARRFGTSGIAEKASRGKPPTP